MKTNVIMTRKLGEFDIFQRTKDGFFNATDLLSKWNEKFPNHTRRLDLFWETTGLDELMREIIIHEPENLSDDPEKLFKLSQEVDFSSSLKIRDEVELAGNQTIPSSLKIRDEEKPSVLATFTFDGLKKAVSQTSKANKGINKGTWLHPIMFVKFAMYLDPSFEYTVLKFVSDQMINFRKDSGNAYKKLSSQVYNLVPPIFMKEEITRIAKAINWIVFRNHYEGIRNDFGTEEKMKELFDLENKVAELIEEVFLNSIVEVEKYLRKKFVEKYPNWRKEIILTNKN